MSILDRTDVVRRGETDFRLKWLGGFIAAAVLFLAATASAQAQTRSLKLHFIHTKERAEITYMRNGRYDQNGLNQVNRLLRDWRRNEPGRMDPQLLDILWEVYRTVGASDYIHVVSAYRSPATNSMLRNRSSGVAQNSQHTLGKAIDFYIPGVPLSRLRAAGFKVEAGGVGFYPKSGSPFIHLDTGNVRSWPRMSRSELMALFPDGRTIHLPSDGKPLPGYQQALAAYESRKRSGNTVQVASSGGGSGGGGGLLATLFSGGSQSSSQRGAPASAPAAATARASAPTPSAAVPTAQPAPAQAAPARQTPETIIAALPARDVPLPGAAPRPMVDVGAPAQPLIAGLPAADAPAQPEPEQAPEQQVAAASVPLPTRRPEYAPAAVEPATQIAAADDAVGRDLPVAAILPERAPDGGAGAIAELLASSAAEARADVVLNPPVPELRPRLSDPTEGARQVASVLPEAGGEAFVLASLPNTSLPGADRSGDTPAVGIPTFEREERAAALAASPRIAMLSRDAGSDPSAALESGVRTTTKAAKPQADDARRHARSVSVPVQHELTRWAFQREVTVANAGGTSEPSTAHALVREAPQTVYTTGFQQGAPRVEADRFTGNAVTFLSVARFGTN